MAKRQTAQDLHRARARARPAKQDDEGPEIPPPPLYLGGWLDRLGLKQNAVAVAAQIGKAYMSQLCSGKRDDPKAAVLYRISEAIGVVMNDLYKPPPPRMDVARLRQYDPRTLDRLLEQKPQ